MAPTPPNNNAVPRSVPEISSSELFSLLEGGSAVQVLDVRSPAQVAAGRIDLVPPERFHNIPGSGLIGTTGLAGTGIDPGVPVVVVCGHGNDSRICAAHLNRIGASALSLSGGMASWMMLSVPRLLPSPPGLDRLVQFDRIGKCALTYLLIGGNEALVIDPPRDPAPVLRYADDSGVKVVAVADTHVHADYISGAPLLARERGVPYYLHPADNVSPFDGSAGRLDIRPLRDGMSLPLGACSVRVLHTPGHSPGSVTFTLGSDAAFTGDFLFVASIGRPDIADRTEEWSALLWKSIQRVRSLWPPGMLVYPAHYGSERERMEGGAVCGTFGSMLIQNTSLRCAEESGFVEWVRKNVAAVPPAYRTIKEINLGLLTAEGNAAEELEYGKNECAISHT